MKGFLKALILAPIAIIAVVFAVANRQIVTVSFDPFNSVSPAFALSAPLFLAIILMVMLGVLIGGIATWIAQGRARASAKAARAEAGRLRMDLQEAKLELDLARRQSTQTPGRQLPALVGRDAA